MGAAFDPDRPDKRYNRSSPDFSPDFQEHFQISMRHPVDHLHIFHHSWQSLKGSLYPHKDDPHIFYGSL
jgi:hypothetical protein